MSARCVFLVLLLVACALPAELGTPSVVLSRPSQGGRVTVTGTVDITRVYSSQGYYTCTWVRQQGGESTVVTHKRLFPGPNVNKEDRSGKCDFTESLDPGFATYTYKVLVYPGATEKTQTIIEVGSVKAD
ncbi:uncharacterized protein [Littorina saxatilis]|uniref:uncharacterized protein isoform X2 n=1 Tax=Littorina saxatilis TaxID=31220 RepID=UPI0038B4E253